MDLEGMMLSEMWVREKQIACGLTYRWNLKENQTRLRDAESRPGTAGGGGEGEEGDGKKWVKEVKDTNFQLWNK